MKKRALRIILITAAVAAAVVLAFNIAVISALSSECDDPDKLSYVAYHLFSDPPGVNFRKALYRLTGKVTARGVRSGKDGYLFPTKTDGFDYDADIRGEAPYDGETLSAFLRTLKTRSDAFAQDGCVYSVFVLPNSQTVMTDRLNTGKTAETAAQKLEKYLHDNGFANFHLLDTALAHSKYDTYHNTENAVNDYGAYLVYRQIASLLPEQIGRRARQITLTDADISVSYSEGRSLARAAGIEKLARNKNVYYGTGDFTDVYETSVPDALTVTAMKDEYNGFIGRSEILIQCPTPYERGLFMTLFSATYTNVVYEPSLGYSDCGGAIKPAACVCIVREDMLTSLLDPADGRSYELVLEGAETGGITPAPIPVTASFRRDGTLLVAGRCETECRVTVASSSDSVTVSSLDGMFITELKAEKGERLRFYAEAENRERSATSYFAAPTAKSADGSVFAGKGSMLCYSATFPDYTGENLLRSDGLSAVRERFESIVGRIRAESGKDTKVIFLAAPDPLSVYPEAAPSGVAEKRSDVTRLDQFRAALSDIDGFTFLDVRAVMRENTDIAKLYYQTDTHWTEAGAYFGYRAIIEEVGKTFGNVVPYSYNAFTPTYADASPGDLSGFAGFTGIKERICLLTPGFRSRAVGLPAKPETIDRSVYGGELLSACSDGTLPVAVMIRDSYSANLFPVISEHFSLLYAQKMWRYEPDYKKIAEYSPDFVIYVICERNLGQWE